MSVELERLESAAADFELQADDAFVDPGRLSAVIDRLKGKLCRVLQQAIERNEHQPSGRSACGWVAMTCGLSRSSASDQLCVGSQLESLPQIAQALSSGQIGYQAAAVICHFHDKLGDKGAPLSQEEWIGHAQQLSVEDLRWLAQNVRYLVDPDGFDHDVEVDYEQRFLKLSESGGMFHLSGVLDREGGTALKAAIESLAKRLGEADYRKPTQRRADALVEIAKHAMDEGRLPRRNGVRPHITVTTTLEGLKGELGAPASELQSGGLVSSKTVQRLACDGTLSRILKADSVVVDVGRATRSVSPAQWRALKARHKTCSGPGCDRPLNWTNPHHLEFWSRGGRSDLHNLLPLCYHHHRLVHEGGWQVVKAGAGYRFIPPDRVIVRRARGPGMRWAA